MALSIKKLGLKGWIWLTVHLHSLIDPHRTVWEILTWCLIKPASVDSTFSQNFRDAQNNSLKKQSAAPLPPSGAALQPGAKCRGRQVEAPRLPFGGSVL